MRLFFILLALLALSACSPEFLRKHVPGLDLSGHGCYAQDGSYTNPCREEQKTNEEGE
jgi:hypothetical protein